MHLRRWILLVPFSTLCTSSLGAEAPGVSDKHDSSRPRIMLQRDLSGLDERVNAVKRELEQTERQIKVVSDLTSELQSIAYPTDFEAKLQDFLSDVTRAGRNPPAAVRTKLGANADDLVDAFVEPIVAWQRKYVRLTGNPSLSTDERNFVRAILVTVDLSKAGPRVMPEYMRVITAQNKSSDPFASWFLQSTEPAAIAALKGVFSQKQFEDLKRPLLEALSKVAGDLRQRHAALETQLKSMQSTIDLTVNELAKKDEGQFQIDSKLISYVLPAFAATLLVLFLVPLRFGGAELQVLIFSSGLILELVTVFLLAGTILILGVAGRINPDVLGTLLGGISGYVLGRSTSAKGTVATQRTAGETVPQPA